MLQQTQAARVVAPYAAFVTSFPTPSSCAAATPGAVVRAWAGLGYNRRALNLHRAAVAMRDHHAGEVPAGLEELRRLPGVGPYTARAVVAFAFEVVDTNVRRVLCRAVAGRTLTTADVQALADRLVPPGRAWLWNQGLMEIGAVVCTSRAPRCAACPLARQCTWRTAGVGRDDPAASGRSLPFEGSDRQGRGRIVAALRRGPLRPAEVAAAAGWPDDRDRTRAVVARLVAEGLVRRGRGGVLSLP